MSEFIEKLQEKRNRWVITNKENDFEEGIISLLTELYPDNAHFIYELLQNAEDAEAQKVLFELRTNNLTFTHNGKKLFSENDIEAITNIGKGTKKDDVNKIGKFGVGFKSVFSYTQSPRIHSGDYNFKITDLVVPHEIKAIEKGKNETVFIFPFNNELKSGNKAYDEINEGLRNINRTTLLFLNSISEIGIKVSNESYSIIKHTDKESRISRITNTKLNKQTKFLVFSKPLPKEERLYVSIAFRLIKDKKTKNDKLTTDNEAKVSIYFPAEKETSNLKFHIHAPFASTVARDSIKDRPENNELIDIIADLLCEATVWIKENGFLNDDFIRCLPIDDDNISTFYKPIQSKIIDLFNNQPFLLCDDDEYHPAKDCWQSTKRLKAVISTQDLKTLLTGKINNDCFWATRPFQRNASGRVNSFLKSLKIRTYNEDDFERTILSLTEHFIEHPNDIRKELKLWKNKYSWLSSDKLYIEIVKALHTKLNDEKIAVWLFTFIEEKHNAYSYYTDDIKDVIKANYSHIVINELLANKENYWLKLLYELLFEIIDIDYDYYDDEDYCDSQSEYECLRLLIKLKNGLYNFSKSDCYFPSETSIASMQNFIVDTAIYEDNLNKKKASKSKRFLKCVLGVKEIAIDDEVIHILKKYEGKGEIEHIDNIKHISLFLKYYKENKSNFSNDFFGKTPFLLNSDNELSKPNYILIDKPIKETSLSLLADEKYKPLHTLYFEPKNNISQRLLGEFLYAVGCCSTLPIEETELSWDKRNKLDGNRKETEYCINKNYCIPLQQCLKSPTIETSSLIWNNISAIKNSEYFYAKYRANNSSTMHTCDSDVIEILKTSAWIPDTKGGFYKPEDLTLDNLHNDFNYNNNNGWLTRIGFGTNLQNNEELKQINDIVEKEFGISVSQMKTAKESGINISKLIPSEIEKKQQLNLKTAINNHNREIHNTKTQLSPSIVSDNEKYREKAQQQLYKNITRSENKRKSYNFSKNVKVGKDETIEFLRKQYQGHCQICGFTFLQSGNKGNYFEMFDWLSEKISKQVSNIIDVGSSLSLCSRCHSVLKYGDFGADFLDNIQAIENSDYAEFAEYFDLIVESDEIPEDFEFIEMDMFKLPIRKLNKEEYIFFSEEHFIHFHNVLTLNRANREEEELVDKPEISNNLEQEEVELEPKKVVEIGDIITVKYSSAKEPFKLKLVSIAQNRKDKDGTNLISASSPFGKKVKGQPEGYIFEIGRNIIEIINIE